MTITDLYPEVQALKHADKLRLMQFLITEFAREEHINLETTPSKSVKNIDALQTLANMAQPLDDKHLKPTKSSIQHANNFADFIRNSPLMNVEIDLTRTQSVCREIEL